MNERSVSIYRVAMGTSAKRLLTPALDAVSTDSTLVDIVKAGVGRNSGGGI